jgi:tRNA-specific 2-thiouridylase
MKQNQAKHILVGVNGGLNSMVAAYLLKKQGHKVSAVGVSFVKGIQPLESDIFERYYIKDLTQVKKALDKFDIPFFAASAEAEFEAQVTDLVIAARLAGQEFAVDAYYNKLLMKVLKKKAEVVGAHGVATGHFAKLSLSSPKHIYPNVLIGNELEFDQSAALSLVDSADLLNVEFPLSELKLTEVKKIADLMGLTPLKKSHHEFHESLMDHKNLPAFVSRRSPDSLRKLGDIYNYQDDMKLGPHSGIHLYRIGQKKLEIPIASNFQVVRIDTYKGDIYVDSEKKLRTTHFFLNKVSLPQDGDYSRAQTLFVKVLGRDKKILANIYFKNNNCLLVELKEELNAQFAEGTLATFYSKDGVGGKVLGAGHIRYAGVFEAKKIKLYPDKDYEDEERPLSEKEKKYSKLDYWY